MYTYFCGKCGWNGSVEESHVALNEHLCPECKVKTYHFQADRELVSKVWNDKNASWLNGGCIDDACPLCWAESGLQKPDYDSLIIPENWTDDTKKHCSNRQRGISADLEFPNVPFKAVVRSLGRDEVLEHKAHFHLGLVKTGGSWFNLKVDHLFLQDWDEAIRVGEKWMIEEGDAYLSKINTAIAKLHDMAKAKGYKAGWVWYRVKDEFGVEIANAMLPKAE